MIAWDFTRCETEALMVNSPRCFFLLYERALYQGENGSCCGVLFSFDFQAVVTADV